MITEYGERYVLGLRHAQVEEVEYDAAAQVARLSLTGEIRLAVSGPLRLTPPSGRPGGALLPLADVAQLAGSTIASAVASKSGHLRLVFGSGHFLRSGSGVGMEITLVRPGFDDWSWREGAVTSGSSSLRFDGGGRAWSIPVSDVAVRSVIIDAAISIDFHNGWLFRLECPFTFTDTAGEEYDIVPDVDARARAPVLDLSRSVGRSAQAYSDGRLEVRFRDGSAVRVLVDEHLDAWMASGAGDVQLVSLAGGGLELSGVDGAPPAPRASEEHGRR